MKNADTMTEIARIHAQAQADRRLKREWGSMFYFAGLGLGLAAIGLSYAGTATSPWEAIGLLGVPCQILGAFTWASARN